MWNWDQGRLKYFQYDEIRKIAKLAVSQDLKALDTSTMSTAVGLPFSPNQPSWSAP